MKTKLLMIPLIVLALALIPCLGAVQQAQSETQAETPVQAGASKAPTFTFGINSTDSPVVIARKILPILKAMEHSIEQNHGKKITIRFKVFRTYDASIQAFVDGSVDFGRLGPISYVLAKRKQPGLRLLAMENRSGKKWLNGTIIVHRDSPIKTLRDLKGKSFAFGNEVSTTGRYLSQRELARAGVCADDLARYKYLRRHDNVFTAVALKQFDAGALKITTVHARNKTQEPVRILHRFPFTTKPWLARAGLKEDDFNLLRNALLGLDDQEAFKTLKIDGFFPAVHEEYDMIEEALFRNGEFFQCGSDASGRGETP